MFEAITLLILTCLYWGYRIYSVNRSYSNYVAQKRDEVLQDSLMRELLLGKRENPLYDKCDLCGEVVPLTIFHVRVCTGTEEYKAKQVFQRKMMACNLYTREFKP